MDWFSHPEFRNHERVVTKYLKRSGLWAIISIHNTKLGPALGGCRMIPYGSFDEALRDVLRLSYGMTLKSSIARLFYGGGKAVIWGDPKTQKSEELLEDMGEFIEEFGGTYISGEDMNITVEDCRVMARKTKHVGGIVETPTGGDPSPMTAYGVEMAMRAALGFSSGNESFDGRTVLIEGLGKVGMPLAKNLHEAGAKLFVTDIDELRVQRAQKEFGATPTSHKGVKDLQVDIYAPCARGGVVNETTARVLKTRIVCGSANNTLATPEHGEILKERGIVYVPDYVANCGGLIDIYYQNTVYDVAKVREHTKSVTYDRTKEILFLAQRFGQPTAAVADAIAESRFFNELCDLR